MRRLLRLCSKHTSTSRHQPAMQGRPLSQHNNSLKPSKDFLEIAMLMNLWISCKKPHRKHNPIHLPCLLTSLAHIHTSRPRPPPVYPLPRQMRVRKGLPPSVLLATRTSRPWLSSYPMASNINHQDVLHLLRSLLSRLRRRCHAGATLLLLKTAEASSPTCQKPCQMTLLRK